MPSSVRASVVLPLPDSPTSPSVSPGQIAALDVRERVHLVAALLEDLRQLLDLDERCARRGRPAELDVRGLLAREAGARSWYQQRLS